MKTLSLLLMIIFSVSAQLFDTTSKTMDNLLLTIPAAANIDSYNDFKSISVDGGIGIQCNDDDCIDTLNKLELPAGVLLSDRKAYLYMYNEKMIDDFNRRLVIAKELYNLQINKANDAATLYEKRIEKLEKLNKRSWLEKNSIYIGFVIGVATAIAIESITVNAID